MEIAVVIVIAVVALGVVAYPLVTRSDGSWPAFSEDALNEQVARYRDAIRRGTLCDRCLNGNPPGSQFCSDCGRRLG